MMSHDPFLRASPDVELWRAVDAREWLLPPGIADNKVSRGVLAARIGSAYYPGAAVLGVSAAWRTGIGMVRYIPPIGDPTPAFGLPSPAAAVLAARPETVFGEGSCDAWLLGSGTDASRHTSEETAAVHLLHQGESPIVLDAGALGSALPRDSGSAPAVLTPHLGEFLRLCAAADIPPAPIDPGARATPAALATVSQLAARLSATMLLKGSTSIIVSPHGRMIFVGPATPWLATAGTGDVLAGILGALVARHSAAARTDRELLAPIAATAALVHDVAARIASGDNSRGTEPCTGAPVTALDVANAVPQAVQQIRQL